MKKTIKFMAMLLCAAMVCGLTSCNREEDDGNGDGDGVSCGETHGEWVDLGLPSGLLWYSVNIGASSPEQYGCYFAWGETQTKEVYDLYDLDTYTYGDYDSATCTHTIYKYNTKEWYGTVDNKTVLEASDDVATAVLGAGARMPTHDDWVELRDNTTGEWTEQNGVNGWKFTATNGQSLFLPAAGDRDGSSLKYAGTDGYYWSSSLRTDVPLAALGFDFGSNGSVMGNYVRYLGLSVRAVRASQN